MQSVKSCSEFHVPRGQGWQSGDTPSCLSLPKDPAWHEGWEVGMAVGTVDGTEDGDEEEGRAEGADEEGVDDEGAEEDGLDELGAAVGLMVGLGVGCATHATEV